jgi:hypothetical protein
MLQNEGYQIAQKENLILTELEEKMRECNNGSFDFMTRDILSERISIECRVLGYQIIKCSKYDGGCNVYEFEKI